MTYSISTDEFKINYKKSSIDKAIIFGNHCHPQFELIGVLEGDIIVSYEDKKFQISSNQFIILPPFGYHTIISNKMESYQRITAMFDVTAIPQAIQPYFLDAPNVITSSSIHIESIKNICKKEQPELYAPLVQALMILIFYDSIPLLSKGRNVAMLEQNEILQLAIFYIDQHLYERIKIEDIVNHISYSKSAIQNIFKKNLNTSPKQYILSKKLMLARKLICDGMSPTEASKKFGYNNYSDFYRMYVKYFHETPSTDKIKK